VHNFSHVRSDNRSSQRRDSAQDQPVIKVGGTKRSGHGRELAAAGIREFTIVRTYWVSTPAAGGVEPDTRGDRDVSPPT
jgi:succinate-semialdehyde dehydrogenase/glutarate-semialdehyde dehydrogenase